MTEARAPAAASPAVTVRRLEAVDDAQIDALAEVLVDCVEGGASVSFMLPFALPKAVAFWRRIAVGVAAGERALLVAEDADGEIVGTVQVVLDLPENQPHRAEISKMLVHRRGRRHGIGAALMAEAENVARAEGRTLLVLDTASADAERLYARLGWQRCGAVPGFALLPGGGLCATSFFYRELGPPQAATGEDDVAARSGISQALNAAAASAKSAPTPNDKR